MTQSAFLSKIERIVPLRAEDRDALAGLINARIEIAPRTTLFSEGDKRDTALIFHSGWALRYRTLADGRRQILSLVLPGEMCDPVVFIKASSEFSAETVTRAEVSRIDTEVLFSAIQASPRVGAALWWIAAHELAIARHRVVAVGRQSAAERMAYYFWELWRRLEFLQAADNCTFEFPITQEELGDLLGLSTVHVNRTLGELRRRNLIRLQSKRLTILDPEGLRLAGDADDVRIHLRGLPERLKRRLSGMS